MPCLPTNVHVVLFTRNDSPFKPFFQDQALGGNELMFLSLYCVRNYVKCYKDIAMFEFPNNAIMLIKSPFSRLGN